jgi:hypothetical protein
MPIWTSAREPVDITLRLDAGCPSSSECSFQFTPECFTPYGAVDLPIRPRSTIPYAVDVSTAAPGYLETPRAYFPGYEATVNGRPAEVLKSPEGNAMVAVVPGLNTVDLEYHGTPPMRISFWISLIGWAGALFYALQSLLRSYFSRTRGNASGAAPG